MKKLDENMILVVSGRNGDTGQILIASAQLHRQHVLNYGQTPSLRSMAQNVKKLFHTPTASYTRRPYGCNAVIAAYEQQDKNGQYSLYVIDADGSLTKVLCFRCRQTQN